MKKALLWGGLALLLLAMGLFAVPRLLDKGSSGSDADIAQVSGDVVPASSSESDSTGISAGTDRAASSSAGAPDVGAPGDGSSAGDATGPDTASADAQAAAQAAIAQAAADAKAKADADALAAAQKAAADKAAADKVIADAKAAADAKAIADAKAAADAKALADARAAEERRRKEREAIGGRWTGVYRYAAGSPAPVRFTIDLIGDTGVFSGRMSEPNTFGDASAAFLFANITGRVSGNRVTFTKTYDGTGGQSHSVPYEGTLDKGTMTVRGNWRIDQTGGSFEMKKGS